jgi:hypothetical protein
MDAATEARNPKLRGRRQPIALALPPELVAEVDVVAAAEDRSRAKMIELLLKDALHSRPSQRPRVTAR